MKNDPTSADQQSREEVNVDRLDRIVVSRGRTRIRVELFVQKFCNRWQKKGPPLGIGGPRRRVSIAGVVFTPARGVIHPSFPLRGRWERSAKSDKQAPSPSLASFHISSFETRPRNPSNARLPPMWGSSKDQISI